MATTTEPDDLLDVLAAMECKGGRFIRSLADTWRYADPVNRGRLMIAFGDYYAKYREVARQEAGKP